MEAIKRLVNSRLIEGIIDLPESFKEQDVELIILPVDFSEKRKSNYDLEIDDEVKKISGIIDLKGKDYKEFITNERIKDYEDIS